MEDNTNKWKKGDINPETGMIFSHMKHSGKEQWYCQEAWENRKETQRKYRNSDKIKKYHQEYFQKNKNKLKEDFKKSRVKRLEEYPLRSLLSGVRGNAGRRNMEFTIDIDFVMAQWDKQEGKCFYTGVKMAYTSAKKIPWQASIDRMDSSKGYTPENSILCCQSVNYMKNDYDFDVFLKFLEDVKEGFNSKI